MGQNKKLLQSYVRRKQEELWQLCAEVKGSAQCVHVAGIDQACSCRKLRNDALEQGFLLG